MAIAARDFRELRLDGMSRAFGTVNALKDVTLTVRRGEFIALLGPSGCGKSTALNCLAGLLTLSAGSIWLDKDRIDGLKPEERGFGMVFQNYALFPHMTVRKNIAFGLTMQGRPKAEIERKVDEALAIVRLGDQGHKLPGQLSGGQQQRVAIARAIVIEPPLVLMDEPLGALDKQLREQMQLEIRRLHQQLGVTMVYVTHDQSEALTMSDRVAVFNKGRIEQIGTPRQVYDEPATRFVAEFIGETNLVEGVVEAVEGAEATVRLSSGARIVSAVSAPVASGQPVYLSIRAERVDLSETRGEARNVLETEVADFVYQGDHLRVQLQNDAHPLIAKLGRRSREFPPGTKVYAAFSAGDCRVIAP
jgi:putative spermidine/putrescine transport system ATP-binding protein